MQGKIENLASVFLPLFTSFYHVRGPQVVCCKRVPWNNRSTLKVEWTSLSVRYKCCLIVEFPECEICGVPCQEGTSVRWIVHKLGEWSYPPGRHKFSLKVERSSLPGRYKCCLKVERSSLPGRYKCCLKVEWSSLPGTYRCESTLVCPLSTSVNSHPFLVVLCSVRGSTL